MNFKPLELRKENNVMYRMLSAGARGILAVPAQSASSERIFSRIPLSLVHRGFID